MSTIERLSDWRNRQAGRVPRYRSFLNVILPGVSAILALWLFTALQPNAAANMRPLLEFERSAGAAFIMFLMNLPMNMLAFSALLLVICTAWGKRSGNFPKATLVFISRVFLLVFIMTILGVGIDFLFLYSYETKYLFQYDLMKWAAAALAVGASVYLLSLVLLRLDLVLGAIPAVAMAGVNLVSWWLTYNLFNSSFFVVICAPSFLSSMLSAIPVYYLFRWHEKAFQHELASTA